MARGRHNPSVADSVTDQKDGFIRAYEGSVFSVTLDSNPSSTGYSWCLVSIPAGIGLLSMEFERGGSRMSGSPGKQIFNFIAFESSGNKSLKIEFKSVRPFDIKTPGDAVVVSVTVISSKDGGLNDFVKYTENGAEFNAAIPYGVFDARSAEDNPAVKYGFICDTANAHLAYGYNCGVAGVNATDAVLKYGYPCGVADANANVAYGINCAAANNNFKYGYPCGVADANANVAYGINCAAANNNFKYGYPCGVADAGVADTVLKYGYPCGIADANANVAYGINCAAAANNNFKYGYPCGVDAALKYGYPCVVANCATEYGYPGPAPKYGYYGCC